MGRKSHNISPIGWRKHYSVILIYLIITQLFRPYAQFKRSAPVLSYLLNLEQFSGLTWV